MCPQLFREIETEITNLLSELIQIDTSNPPGNEVEAANFLAKTLEQEGFQCELFESTPGRGNLITRLQGSGEKPNLLLLSHLDVVPANPKEWSVDPFSGLVKDGFVWGRGTRDMKGMAAMEVMVMKLLKRNGVKPRGDVILAATADEEKGGGAGAKWIVENYPEKVRAGYVINEGGGQAIPVDGKNLFTIQTAEKGINWFRVRAKGSPGHGSVPGAADNAIMRMSDVISKLGNYRAKISLLPTVKIYLEKMAQENENLRHALVLLLKNPTMSDKILDVLAQTEKAMAERIRAMLRMTITPTIIHGGLKENIIPSECETAFDCRILPGQTPAEAMADIKNLLKEVPLDKLEFTTIQADMPSESPADTPFYEQLVKVLKAFEPNCAVTPLLVTGGTDSRFFRNMGIPSYGFQPTHAELPLGELMKMVHGIDERISIDNLVFGTSVLYSVIEKFLG